MADFTPYEKEDKEYKENKLVHVEDVTIPCADCGKSLVTIRITLDTDKTSNIKAKCPHCDGESFVTKVKGETYIEACAGGLLTDIKYPMVIVDNKPKYDSTKTIIVEMRKQ